MVEHAQRGFEPEAKHSAPPQAGNRPGHETLQRRAALQSAGYSALLNARAPGPQPIQRLAANANFYVDVQQSAVTHGYDEDMIRAIVTNRISEVVVGQSREMLVGRGLEENNRAYGRLVYNCSQNQQTYTISVFHMHGGQTEPANRRGY